MCHTRIYTYICLYINIYMNKFSKGFLYFLFLYLCIYIPENRYKHEATVEGEPVLFELLDTCPKVSELSCQCVLNAQMYILIYVYMYYIQTDCRLNKAGKCGKDIRRMLKHISIGGLTHFLPHVCVCVYVCWIKITPVAC